MKQMQLLLMFRIIQSIPLPKAEPIKQWIAQLCQERLDGITDSTSNRKSY